MGLPSKVVLEVLRRFDQTILTICEGQFLDLSYESDLSITEEGYLAMISRKTAALIAAATGLGAIVGGADAESSRALFDFGQHLGLAFQVQDDILGIWGDPTITGKPFAADLYQKKVSLPIIHALRHADYRDELTHIYRQHQITDEDVHRLLHILDQTDARAQTEQVAERYHRAAMQSLSRVHTAGMATAETALAQIRAIGERLSGRHA
jgi:geranylgeranyl diphosphate synthase type I